jgi:putative methionine-R-sulfoxide reductase with GAF domain
MGFAFIAITAAVLAWLLRGQFARLAETEAARQSQAERLSAIADVVPGGLYITDASGAAVYANRAIRDLFDTPEIPAGTSLAGLKAWEFREWSGRPLPAAELPSVVVMRDGQAVSDRRYLVTTPSGRRVYASINAAPLHDPQGAITGAIVAVTDMTRLQAQRAELERRGRVLSMISSVEREITRNPPENELMEKICRVMVEEGGYRLAWIGLVADDPARTVRIVAAHGAAADAMRLLRIEAMPGTYGNGPTGRAIRENRPFRVDDVDTDPMFTPWREAVAGQGIRSMVSVPLVDDRGAVIGALAVFEARPEAFNDEEMALLGTLAKDLAYGIVSGRANAARRQAEARYETVLSGVLRAMARLLEIRDPFTAGHELRTAQISLALAGELGLDPGTIEGLRIAAELHDIGKFVVPAEILSRPSRLSKTELEIVMQHPGVGEEVLGSIEFAWPIATIVGQHHERLDGSGYPRGLKGDAIRLEARILAVADVYEAVTSQRPHRPAFGHEEAMAELHKGAGSLFDPAVVEALDRLSARQGTEGGMWMRSAVADQRDATD